MAAPIVMSAASVASASGRLLSKLRFGSFVRKMCDNMPATAGTVNKEFLESRFKGCLVGSLMGDCLGAPYEDDTWDELPNEVQLNDYIQQLVQAKVKIPFKPYTDDTAMTRCVAKSLIAKHQFDPKDMATRFTKEYFTEPRRGYGSNVPQVFGNLRKDDYEHPYQPAREQFNGRGSYGNGGAMRVAPVALFCHNDVNSLIDVARKCTLITHSHREGYNGAILQCLAVHQALHADPGKPLDGVEFLHQLRAHMERLEDCSEEEIVDAGRLAAPYQKLLTVVEELLKSEPAPLRGSVLDLLGHDVSALNSVPTAIYCFLHTLKPQDHIKTNSGVVRAIQYAISLGGDTDTIASMAGAMAGAYHGLEGVPAALLPYCEKADEAVSQAQQLFDQLEQ